MNDMMLDRRTLSSAWQEHMHAEFVLKDADAALATMTDEPYVMCIPTGTSAVGRTEVREFYARCFLPSIPPDFELSPVSQVFGNDRLVEESVVRFTHTLAMDWMLPDMPPTGRKVEFALVVIVGFQDGKVAHEHIHWDQLAVLAQLGKLGHPAAKASVSSAARLLELSQRIGVC